MTPAIWWIAPASALGALLVALHFYRQMLAASEGSETMKTIAGYVREGAMAYLSQQYKIVSIVFLVLMVVLGTLAWFGIQNPFVPIAFLSGGAFSALCGFIGMKTATNASARTAYACSHNLNRGLTVAFRSGAVMGLVVAGFGLLDICLWYWLLDHVVYTPEHMQQGWSLAGIQLVPRGIGDVDKLIQITATMVTFGMGASTQALLARVGGGIYTKAADVGADLVGKVEVGIPEDDPRNPATVADNVGDNVGDVAGMGADLYESYCGSILATAALGAAVGAEQVMTGGSIDKMVALVIAPMVVAGIGILLSIAGMFFVRCGDNATQRDLLRALLIGTLGSSVLVVFAMIALATTSDLVSWGIVGAVVAGLAAGVIIGQATEYYTSDEYQPTRGIAEQAKMGPATAIIDGLATGLGSVGAPVVTIAVGTLCAFVFAGGFANLTMGLYGVGFAAVGMLSTLAITLATDAYGPIADNAGGNAEMASLPPEVRQRTDALDSLGNTTAATGKGFAIGSAALTAMALLAAYLEEVRLWGGRFAQQAADPSSDVFVATDHSAGGIERMVETYNLTIMNPLLLCGLFIGGMLAFVFSSMTMKAVGRAAGDMVNEVRRQFRAHPGIMQGTETPDYARCVAISTAGAQREMVAPAVLAIAAPILTGLILGVAGVMGMLAGGLVAGFLLATALNNAGGAWDNAKKYIEKGAHGGKGSEAHKASVIGDTVGDPCKDTSGPSLNILIKLLTMVSVVFSPVVVKFSPMVQSWLGLGN
jgi:K(+)-stimulated pyrophosphate-energized sodium pump